MRTFKFRAWDSINKIMFIPNSASSSSSFSGFKGGELEVSAYIGKGEWIKFPIMFFTGLMDKNGKEIFEGDIVKCTDGADEISYLNSDTGIGVISFLCGCWYIDKINNELFTIDQEGYVEVIGNIYENPELLEQTKMTDIIEKTKEYYLDRHHELVRNIIYNEDIKIINKLELIQHIVLCSAHNLFNGIAGNSPDRLNEIVDHLCDELKKRAKFIKIKKEFNKQFDKQEINTSEKRINDLYKSHTTACWAKNQLRILADMAEDRNMQKWFVEQLRKIADGILIVGSEGN